MLSRKEPGRERPMIFSASESLVSAIGDGANLMPHQTVANRRMISQRSCQVSAEWVKTSWSTWCFLLSHDRRCIRNGALSALFRGLGDSALPRSRTSSIEPRQLLALTASSLHCRDSVRLQSYIPCPDEPASTPVRDPGRTLSSSAQLDELQK